MQARRACPKIDSVMQRIQEIGVNLLAIDFDQTIIALHTGGRWTGTIDELVPSIRPQFRQLIYACVEHDVRVAVVTYSPQISTVRAILEHIVGPEQAARIPIRGGDKSWSYDGKGSMDGKQPHMASAVEELEQSGDIEITKETTVLIDDDRRNIKYALANGVRAVWLNPKKPDDLLKDLARLV